MEYSGKIEKEKTVIIHCAFEMRANIHRATKQLKDVEMEAEFVFMEFAKTNKQTKYLKEGGRNKTN